MARPAKQPPKPDVAALEAAIAAFRAAYPKQWDALALCPLKYGLDEILNGLRRL